MRVAQVNAKCVMKEFWGGVSKIINFQTQMDISRQQSEQH